MSEVQAPGPAPRAAGAQAATDAFWLVITAYLGQFLTLGLAFVLRKQLGPAGMGYVAITTLVASYAPYVSLGAAQAAEREISLAIGRGDEREAESLEAGGSVTGLLIGLVAATVLAVLAMIRWPSDALLGGTLMCAAAVLLLQQVGVWATFRMRTRYRFRTLGWVTALSAVVVASLNVAGAALGGTAGTLIAVATGSVLTAGLMAYFAGLHRVSIHSRAVARRLAVLAPGFLASGATMVLLGSIDQLAVTFLLGTTSLGLYSAAYLGYNFVIRVPTLIGSVIYPRLQRQLGASDDKRRVFGMASRTTAAVVVVMPAMVAVFYVALPALVYLLLPEFRPAVDPMRLLLLGLIGMSFAMPATQYLITVNRQWLQVLITAVFLAAMAGAYIVAAVAGQMSLLMAAIVDVVGYYGYGVTVQLAAHRIAGVPLRAVISYMPIHVLSAVVLVIAAAGSNALFEGAGPVGVLVGAALQAAVFGVAWIGLAAWFIQTHRGSREDFRILLNLVVEGLTRIRRFVLAPIS